MEAEARKDRQPVAVNFTTLNNYPEDPLRQIEYEILYIKNGDGQIYIGNGSQELPYPWEKHPELIDASKDTRPHSSCSMADSLERHGLFINQFIATGVLEMIWQLFRHGGLDYSELYINLKTGRMMPKLINPEDHPNE